MYNLPENYTHRLEPEYFNDVLSDSSAWQADVYALAAQLARESGARSIRDLGCGNGLKLKPYSDEFHTVGYDYGKNIETFIANKAGDGIIFDFEKDMLYRHSFENSVVICADMIEHLINPTNLVASLYEVAQTAKYVLVSTPDRERVYKGEHYGPPGNPYHCREWTNAELVAWFRANDLPVAWHGWTVSNVNRRDQVWTSLVILSKEFIVGLPPVFEPAPINWDAIGVK